MRSDVVVMFRQFLFMTRRDGVSLRSDLRVESGDGPHSLHHHMVTAGEILDTQVERGCRGPFFDVAVNLKNAETQGDQRAVVSPRQDSRES